MIDIIKLYNHKKEYIIRKQLSIQDEPIISIDLTASSRGGTINNVEIFNADNGPSYGTTSREINKCRRLLDLFG